MDYLAVRIGVPTEAAARSLSRRLVKERLVAGTRLTHGPSHYWWDGAVQEREYWTITGYTTAERRDALTARIADLHSDEVPGITFAEIDVPPAYREWIAANATGDDQETER